jgi:hypothetical protein
MLWSTRQVSTTVFIVQAGTTHTVLGPDQLHKKAEREILVTQPWTCRPTVISHCTKHCTWIKWDCITVLHPSTKRTNDQLWRCITMALQQRLNAKTTHNCVRCYFTDYRALSAIGVATHQLNSMIMCGKIYISLTKHCRCWQRHTLINTLQNAKTQQQLIISQSLDASIY